MKHLIFSLPRHSTGHTVKILRSILTLGPQVPSAYPAMCEIQREARKNMRSEVQVKATLYT